MHARNFSLMSQSTDMTSASIFILTREDIDLRSLARRRILATAEAE